MNPLSRGETLSILTHAPAQGVQSLAEQVLPHLGEVTVLRSRTGLVMMPFTDSAHGSVFHLGEVLVAEAHIQLDDGTEGYGMVAERDALFAMGVAILDAALSAGIMSEAIAAFVDEQQSAQQSVDDDLLRMVETTRVEMETF
ncbi:MAG: phosphonate C-P lyase system protein PhnG [Chloroflexi bacterium]|nr:phosphonate C-P lyase system protein PhnG [Chloroflexota bacterium]